MLLAEQLVRQRYVRPGPLVLGTAPIKYPAPTTDRDRTVSRRSEPVSYTHLDVYKRQPQHLLMGQGSFRTADEAADGALGAADLLGKLWLVDVVPVSYTQLLERTNHYPYIVRLSN